MSEFDIEVFVDIAPGELFSKTITLKPGASVAAVLQQPWLKLLLSEKTAVDCGVYGKKVANDYVLQPGDRLEFYRPLVIGPKEARRLRAQKQSKKK